MPSLGAHGKLRHRHHKVMLLLLGVVYVQTLQANHSPSVGDNVNRGYGVALSTGGGKLGSYLWSSFSGYCLRRGLRFADMTGDGR